MKTIRTLSIALLLATGVAALLGGGSMLVDPSGSDLGLPLDLLKTTPFLDYFVPGLVLFVTVGVLSIVTGILTITRNRFAVRLTILEGTILSAWIALQALMLQMMNPIQIAVGGIGFTLFCLGLFQADTDPAAHKHDYTD